MRLLVMAHSKHDEGDHSDCDADTCMKLKLDYWRSGAGAPLKFTYGKDRFHGPTIRERQDKIVKDAAANGIEARLKNPMYDGKRSK